MIFSWSISELVLPLTLIVVRLGLLMELFTLFCFFKQVKRFRKYDWKCGRENIHIGIYVIPLSFGQDAVYTKVNRLLFFLLDPSKLSRFKKKMFLFLISTSKAKV